MSPYAWRVVRRVAIVLLVAATLAAVGFKAYNAEMYNETHNPHCITPGGCGVDQTAVWLFATVMMLAAAVAMFVLVVGGALLWMYIVGPGSCKGCSCPDHRRRVHFDNGSTATTAMLAATATVIATM